MSTTTSTDHSAHDDQGAKQTRRWSTGPLTLVRLAAAVGLTAFAVALIVVLTRSPLTLAGDNGVPANLAVGFIRNGRQRLRERRDHPTGHPGDTCVAVGEHGTTGEPQGLLRPQARHRRRARLRVGNRRNGHRTRDARCPDHPQCTCLHIGRGSGGTHPGQRHEGKVAHRVPLPFCCGWNTCARGRARGCRSPPRRPTLGLVHAPGGSWIAYLLVVAMLVVTVLACACSSAKSQHERRRDAGCGCTASDRRGCSSAFWARGAYLGPRGCARLSRSSAPPAGRSYRHRSRRRTNPPTSPTPSCWRRRDDCPTSSSGAVSPEEIQVTEALHQKEIEWHPEVQVFTSPSARAELHHA